MILSSLLILSIFIVGSPLVIFFMFYNGFVIGFSVASLTCIFGLKGLLFGSIYVLVSKGLFLIMLFILSTTYLKISKNIIEKIIYKNKGIDTIVILIEKVILCIFIVLIIDVMVYFGGAKLINIFNFLIN